METIEAKKNIDYERQVVMFGKEKADTALQFYMLGSNNSEHNKANNPACLLGAVISQRELLIDFSKYLSRYYDIELLEIDIDGYFQEKSINGL